MKFPRLTSIIPDMVPKPAKMFLLGTILSSFGSGISIVVFQLYFISLGFNSVDISSIFMMSSITSLVLTIPMGILADHYGRKKIFLAGILLSSIGLILILSSQSIAIFSLAFLLLGINAATNIVWIPIYSSFFTTNDMDRAFGFFIFLSIIFQSIGNLMGIIPPMLVSHYGFSLQHAYWLMLVTYTGFIFASFPFSLMSLKGLGEQKRQEGFKFHLKSKRIVFKFSFTAVMIMLGYGIFFNLFPFYVNKKFGIESDALGTLLSISNVASAGASIIAARVSKRLGTLNAIVASIALATPFYLMMPLAPNFTWLSILYIIRLGIRALADPLTNSLYMKILHKEEKATGNSIRRMALNGGNVTASWIGGQLMMTHLELPMYLGIGFYVISALSYHFLFKNEEKINSI